MSNGLKNGTTFEIENKIDKKKGMLEVVFC